jgi:hypothetical protein
MSRSLFLTSLLSLCIAAPLAGVLAVGCAAPTDSQDESQSEEQVAETQDELTAGASQLVGSYWTHSPANGGFARLELKSNGHYTASVDPAGKIVCVTSPCLLPESGTWNASKKVGGGFRLRIRAAGQASRWYDASKTSGASATLQLSRNGVSETLAKLGANACLDNADCKSNEDCGPRYCLMYCAVNDPFCCGPSTCQPKAPPPPPAKQCGGFAGIPCGANEECVDDPTDSCDPKNGGAECGGICQPKAPPPPPPPPACSGAWLDQNGTCRTPADGVYPASCCAGQSTPCGPSTCGVGKVCCNPLAGICTNPGEFCIQ